MYYIAIDIGGSSIKHALITENADIIESGSTDDIPKTDINKLVELIGTISDGYSENRKIEGLAVSMPCPVEPKTGRISGGSAVRCLHDGSDVKKMFEQRTGLSVVLENDAKCAGLAEGSFGAAKGCSFYVAVVIGSGVGGSLIINNSIVHGKNLHCGEFGCMIAENALTEPLGSIVSSVSSTVALIRAVAKAKDMKEDELTGKLIYEMADNGDEVVEAILKNFHKYVATLVFNIQYAIDPEKILIGGGISENKRFIDEVNNVLKRMKSRHHVIDVQVEACMFKNQANIIGAMLNFIQVTKNKN